MVNVLYWTSVTEQFETVLLGLAEKIIFFENSNGQMRFTFIFGSRSENLIAAFIANALCWTVLSNALYRTRNQLTGMFGPISSRPSFQFQQYLIHLFRLLIFDYDLNENFFFKNEFYNLKFLTFPEISCPAK